MKLLDYLTYLQNLSIVFDFRDDRFHLGNAAFLRLNAIELIYVLFALTENLFLKPRPNGGNMQYIATFWGAKCCVRLAPVLRHAGCYWLRFYHF